MISITDISRLRSGAAVSRFIERGFDGSIDAFVAGLNETANKLVQSDLKKAKRLIGHIHRLSRLLPREYRPNLLVIEARAEHWTGNSSSAAVKYAKAISLFEKKRDFKSAALTRQGLMDVYMYLGKYDKALSTGKKALTYLRRKGEGVSSAKVMTNIGNVYHRLDKNRLALSYYNKARDIFEPVGGLPLAVVDYNRANVLANMSKFDEAADLYRSAATVYREHGLSLAAAKSDYSLAYLHFLRDDYTRALASFERVSETFERLGDEKAATTTLMDLAEINLHLNQYGSTIAICERIIPSLVRQGLKYELAKSHYFMARALISLGDHREGLGQLKSAGKLFEREHNDLWSGMVRLELCRRYLDEGRQARSASLAAETVSIFKSSGDKRHQTDAELLLLRSQIASGEASAALKRGSRLLKSNMLSYQRHMLNSEIGAYHLKNDNPDRALEYFELAAKDVEIMLQSLYPDELQFFFALDKYSTYLGLVECLIRLGRVKESFLKQSRMLSLLNRPWVSEKALAGKVPENLLERRTALRSEIKKLSKVCGGGERAAGASGTGLAEIEGMLWENERKIRLKLRGYAGTRLSKSDPQLDPMASLGPHDTMVTFTSIGGRAGGFIATAKHARFVELPIRIHELESIIREFQFLMERTVLSRQIGEHESDNAASYYLEKLYGLLIEPLGLKSVDKLILMPDGLFSQIPFCALRHPDGKFLKDMFDFRVIVSPEDLSQMHLRGGISPSERSVAFTPSTANLLMAAREGSRIGEVFPGMGLYDGDSATCERLSRELSECDGFVHIATHASRSSENPLFSRILMSDGPFFPFDLFGHGINAKLVTLSGCQTAAPGIYYGNSFSLAKAFHRGGARFVLASLWPVSDKVTMAFMSEFYGALRLKEDITFAYNSALDVTLNIFSDAAYWSPFVMLGI